MRRTIIGKKKVGRPIKSRIKQRQVAINIDEPLHDLICLCAVSHGSNKSTLIIEILTLWGMEAKTGVRSMMENLEVILRKKWKKWVLENKSFEFSEFKKDTIIYLKKKGVPRKLIIEILNNIENGENQ